MYNKKHLTILLIRRGPQTHTHAHTNTQKEMDLKVFIAPSAREERERAGYLAALAQLDDRTFPEHQVPKNGPGQLNPEEARRGDLP